MIPREAILELSDKQYRLQWGRTYLIGRTDNGNLKGYISLPKESTVDAKHATICANSANRSVNIMDLHSAKGTYINGQRLDALQAHEIVSDAALGFGSVKAFLKLYLAEDSPNSSGFDDDPKTISNSTASPEKSAAQLLHKDSAAQKLELCNSKVQIDSIFALKDKANNSVNNSTVDSFLIPETQFASGKRSVLPAGNDSINDSVVERSAVNGSGNDSSDESFIPETQELTTSNRVSQRGQRLQASSNRSQSVASVATESNAGSQFHICTQDFNENYNGDRDGDGDGFETDSSDLLGDVQCSLVIPRITHEPVVLNDFATSSPKAIDVIVTADDEREMATCTPDLFDVPGLAQGNSTITSDNNNSANSTPKASSAAALEIDKSATQCKSIDDIASKPQISTGITSAVKEEDDDDDLMPTQVFCMPQSKKPEHENSELVTLSDKENCLPSSAEDVDDNNKRGNHLADTKSEEDYSLPATQVFSVQSKAKLPKPATSAKADADENATNCIETEMFKRPTVAVPVQKSSSESGSSSGANLTATDASMDVLMCTPQFIKNQFKDYLGNSAKKSLISSKKKSLFGDDSDTEELDILKLMEAPKVSRDFDTLLPHLVQDETKAKLLMPSKKESSSRKKEYLFDKKQRTRSAHTEEKKPTPEATMRVKEKANEEKTNVKDAKNKAETRTQKERPRSTTRNDTDATMRRVTRTRSRCEIEQGEEKAQNVGKSTATESTKKSNKLNSSNASSHRQNQSKESNKLKMRLRSCSPSTDSEKCAIPMKRSTRSHTKDELNTSRDQGKTKTSERVRTREVKEEDTKKAEVNVERLRVKRLHSTTAITTESKDKTTEVGIKRRRLTLCNDVESASTSRDSASATAPAKLKVSMTMVDPKLFEQLAQKSADLWTVAKDPAECDVLIMDKGNRTYKFLLAMSRGIPILTSKWLESVNRKKKFVQNVEFFFADPAFEKRHKFILLKSLEMARKKPLFAGYEFLLTKNILPFPNEMSTIIRSAGGSVLRKPPPLRAQQNVYLISSVQDNKHWHIYRRENSNIRIISTEGVMAAVMRQNANELNANSIA